MAILPPAYAVYLSLINRPNFAHYQVKDVQNKVVWRTTDLYFKSVIIVNSLFGRCRPQKGEVKRCTRAECVCPHEAPEVTQETSRLDEQLV